MILHMHGAYGSKLIMTDIKLLPKDINQGCLNILYMRNIGTMRNIGAIWKIKEAGIPAQQGLKYNNKEHRLFEEVL